MADEVRELNHAYSSTYNKYGSNKVVLVREFYRSDTEGIRCLADTIDKNKPVRVDVPVNDGTIDFGFPARLGNVNYKTFVVHLSRSPLRQYRKALAVNNFKREIISRSMLTAIKKEVSPDRLIEQGDFIYRIFNPTYFSYEESIDMVRKYERISAAFSENLCVGVEATSQHIHLYYRTLLVGIINDDNSITLLQNSQHLRELIQSHLPNVRIK